VFFRVCCGGFRVSRFARGCGLVVGWSLALLAWGGVRFEQRGLRGAEFVVGDVPAVFYGVEKCPGGFVRRDLADYVPVFDVVQPAFGAGVVRVRRDTSAPRYNVSDGGGRLSEQVCPGVVGGGSFPFWGGSRKAFPPVWFV